MSGADRARPVYGLEDGYIHDLGTNVNRFDALEASHEHAMQRVVIRA